MQQPPPESAELVTPTQQNETYRAAYRLAAANLREAKARSVQVSGRSEYLTGPKDVKPLWMRIARFLLVHDVDNFERYIHAQYRYSIARDDTLSSAPNPGTFDTQQAMDRYLNYQRFADASLQQELASANLEFECCADEALTTFPHYSNRQLWNYVLMNTMLELPPLFRYCIATSEQLPAADHFKEAAMQQFLTDPMGYVATWNTALPVELVTDAEITLMAKLR